MRHVPYAVWLVINALFFTGAYWLYHSGVVQRLWMVDEHYVLTTMVSWFLVATMWTGYAAWRIPVDGATVSKRRLSFTAYSAQTMLNLGLFGTTLGFIAMLTAAFVGRDYVDAATFKSVLPLVGSYWAMALYSTCSAIGLGIVLMTESFVLRYITEVLEQIDEERAFEAMQADMVNKFGV